MRSWRSNFLQAYEPAAACRYSIYSFILDRSEGREAVGCLYVSDSDQVSDYITIFVSLISDC